MVGHVCSESGQTVQCPKVGHSAACGGEGYKTTCHTNPTREGEIPCVAQLDEMLWPVSEVKRVVSNLAKRYRGGRITKEKLTSELDLLKRRVRKTILQSYLSMTPEVVIDCFCGTATSAALYHLKYRHNSVVVGIDRDQTEEFVMKFIPEKYRHRFLFVKADMKEISWEELQTRISNKWPSAKLSQLSHVHLSPSCTTMSRAERFAIHRHADLISPKSATAIADDAVVESCVKFVQELRRIAPLALVTIESPANNVFGHLPGIRKLLSSKEWRMLEASYCKEADPEMDEGFWPQKDTSVLTFGLPRWFHGRLCDGNCGHLVPGTAKHRVQLCSGRHTLPSQYVVRDPMVKGMIPHGLIDGIFQAHLVWRRARETAALEKEVRKVCPQWDADVRNETQASILKRSAPAMEIYNDCAEAVSNTAEKLERRRYTAFVNESMPALEYSDDESDLESDLSDAETECHEQLVIDPLDRVEEFRVDENGMFIETEPTAIRPRTEEQDRAENEQVQYISSWARFIPGTDRSGPRWDCSQLRPGELLCADEISFDNSTKPMGKKQHMLFVYDVKTRGIRVEEEKSKVEHGEKFRKMAINEAWNKRPHKVTVIADGCGSMVHLRQAALDLGIGTWEIAPNSPTYNPAEQAISRFKSTVMAVLLSACTENGPITTSFVGEAAKYVAWMHERFVNKHNRLGEHLVSPYELNLGKKPRLDNAVPFGTSGYAFVPEAVRKRRGWGKSVRSEPVLMLGYQNMYSRVYRCLTERGTIIHSPRVKWDIKASLGVFLSPISYPTKEVPSRLELFSEPIFEDCTMKSKAQSKEVPERSPIPASGRAKASQHLPCDAAYLKIRTNPDKTSVKSYIAERCRLLDGTCVADAIGRKVQNAKGTLVSYKWQDFNYDVGCGWILLEKCDSDISAAGQRIALISHARAHAKLLQTEQAQCTNPLEQVSFMMALFAMRDLKWKPYLKGEHREEVIKAHETELNALLSTRLLDSAGVEHPVLEELFEGDSEFQVAAGKDNLGKPCATNCRELLEFKRTGVWKARVVVQGFREDKELLDGPDFIYSSHVVGLSAVRRLLLTPLQNGEATAQVDISTAFLQSNMFEPGSPARYLRLFDPVANKVRFFRQWGVLYGSCSAPVRWMDTLHPWIETQGFVEGKNEQCVFYNAATKVTVATYTDDILARGPAAEVVKFLTALQNRFKCKKPRYFTEADALDHLGMLFFMNERGVFLSMQHYIETMMHNLDLDTSKFRRCRTPISAEISDTTPLSKEEATFFMSGTGMIGWLAVTGRPDLKYAHSRISQHLAHPSVGALGALMHAIRYCHFTKHYCLCQSKLVTDTKSCDLEGPHSKLFSCGEWGLFCDSDQSGNAEVQNKRRSQLGLLAKFGTAPIVWGSKASAVQFKDWDIMTDKTKQAVESVAGGIPVCHPEMDDLHADMSSAAAEVYAASVALGEFLHLSYVEDEMGFGTIRPIVINVDNTTAIAFSENSTKRSKMRHIDCRQLWVQALRDRGLCKLVKVSTDDNESDLFTKILGPIRFEFLRDRMMVEEPVPLASASPAA